MNAHLSECKSQLNLEKRQLPVPVVLRSIILPSLSSITLGNSIWEKRTQCSVILWSNKMCSSKKMWCYDSVTTSELSKLINIMITFIYLIISCKNAIHLHVNCFSKLIQLDNIIVLVISWLRRHIIIWYLFLWNMESTPFTDVLLNIFQQQQSLFTLSYIHSKG